jgi:hypothetical protein
MYMIETTAAAEMTLEGMPIVPVEHPATIIHEGNNWVAFPLTQSMTLTNAFVGFPVNGDQVISQGDGSSTYNNRWRGTLTTLDPNKGYLYFSASPDERTLTFPTSTSKAGVQSMQTSDLPLNVKARAPKTVDILIAPKAQGEVISGLKAILLNKTK